MGTDFTDAVRFDCDWEVGMRHSRVKQSGHAAILFAICVPVLFGVFMLGSDGARALQTKARLEEAAEAAVLAVSAEDSSNHPLAQSVCPSMTWIHCWIFKSISCLVMK